MRISKHRKRIFQLTFIALVGALSGVDAQAQAIGGIPQLNNAIVLEPSNFRYKRIDNTELADGLADELPSASFGDVLSDSDRTGYACQPLLLVVPIISKISASFCWNAEDSMDEDWYPQGITTTGDAFTEGVYQNNTAILTSWYNKGRSGTNKGARVSVIDYSNPVSPKYRNVLLVEPFISPDGISFKPVNVHAGGISWYGDLLYVVDTANGFRVFDMSRMLRVNGSDTTKIGRQPDGSYQAFEYKYILPQVQSYQHYTINGNRRIRHSYVSLDRTTIPDSVIVGEYEELDSSAPRRLIRIPIDSRTRLLGNKAKDPLYAIDVGAEEAIDTQLYRVQGATSVNGKFVLSSVVGVPGYYGSLYVFSKDSLLVTAYPGHLPYLPEDLSYWKAKDQLWTLSEAPGSRTVIALKASEYLR